MGRRRRPARGAARPLPQRPGGARAAGPPGRRRRPHRRVRPHRRAGPARPGRLGQGPDPRPGHAARHRRPRAARRRRPGARPGRGRDHGPAAQPRAPHRPRRPRGGRPGPRPGAEARLPGRDRLRPLPRPGQVRRGGRRGELQRTASAGGPARHAGLPLVRRPGDQLALRALRPRPAPRDRHRRHPHRRGTRPRLPGGQGAHVRRRAGAAGAFPTSPRWSSPRPGPSRWRGRGRDTRPRCCSTAGPCSAGRACARGRRRCAAGSPPPPWSGPTARSWSMPTPASPPPRR